jgi:hypothetical protein
MNELIKECVDKFGEPPRDHSWWLRWSYLGVPRPSWLVEDRSDKLSILFDNLDRLWCEGVVVWAHVVQANQLIWRPGPDNVPGELVYSLEDADRTELQLLGTVARRLYKLKGTSPDDPAEASIAKYISDEHIRVFGHRVPTTICARPRCRMSTTFFVRKHLPLGRLAEPFVPVVVLPEKPHVAMPLPGRFWPDSLLGIWREAAKQRDRMR